MLLSDDKDKNLQRVNTVTELLTALMQPVSKCQPVHHVTFTFKNPASHGHAWMSFTS